MERPQQSIIEDIIYNIKFGELYDNFLLLSALLKILVAANKDGRMGRMGYNS